MSLTITSRISTNQGITVENAYGRVAVTDVFNGTSLNASSIFYASEDAFLQGLDPLSISFITNCAAPYERNETNTDILNVAHDIVIAKLAQQNIVATKNL